MVTLRHREPGRVRYLPVHHRFPRRHHHRPCLSPGCRGLRRSLRQRHILRLFVRNRRLQCQPAFLQPHRLGHRRNDPDSRLQRNAHAVRGHDLRLFHPDHVCLRQDRRHIHPADSRPRDRRIHRNRPDGTLFPHAGLLLRWASLYRRLRRRGALGS